MAEEKTVTTTAAETLGKTGGGRGHSAGEAGSCGKDL